MGKLRNLLIARIDGASRGNPGHSGIGVQIQNDSGNTLREISEYLGDDKTNNQAEYGALIRALKWCEGRTESVRIFSDSQLLVRQMKGEYKVRSPNLKDKFKKAKELESKFRDVFYEHIPRGKNSLADELANEAIERVLD